MTLFFQTNIIRVILNNVQGNPCYIIGVDGAPNSKDIKNALIHYKRSPHGFGGIIKAF